MIRICLYATEYLEQHPDTDTKTAVAKVLTNTRTLRRGINIAVEDKFKTDKITNPYYEDLCNAGITESEFPILADFFDFVTAKEIEFEKEWIPKHKHLGNIRQVRPALKDWKSIIVTADTPQEKTD